jgi:hypothetical protein
VPDQRVYASGLGSADDRNGSLQTAQRMGPAAQVYRRRSCSLTRVGAFSRDAVVVVLAAIGAGPAGAPAMRHQGSGQPVQLGTVAGGGERGLRMVLS